MSDVQYVGPGAVYSLANGETFVQALPPAYLYRQYNDDANVGAFFTSFNDMAEQYLLWWNTLNLPIYTGGIVSGALLDWVGQGLYGISRPSITTSTSMWVGDTDTYETDAVATNQVQVTEQSSTTILNDDYYRRLITWNFYKGDGFVFSTDWLKRRVERFMFGPNGISPTIDQTYAVSVTVGSSPTFTIDVDTPNPGDATILNGLLMSGLCTVPFQYTFALTGSTHLVNSSGAVTISTNRYYPTSSTGLAAGAIWDNAGTLNVVSGATPNPAAPPVYFGQISSLQLYELGGGNLPTTAPTSGSLQLWDNGGVVSVA